MVFRQNLSPLFREHIFSCAGMNFTKLLNLFRELSRRTLPFDEGIATCQKNFIKGPTLNTWDLIHLPDPIALKSKYTRPVTSTKCPRVYASLARRMTVMSLLFTLFHCPTSCFDLPCHQLGGKWRALPMHSQRRRLLDAALLARLLHRPVKSESQSSTDKLGDLQH